MKYYQAGDKLILHNSKNNTLKIKNSIFGEFISMDEFSKLNPIQIKKSEFNFRVNNFFRNIKHDWIHDGVRYKKIDNFEMNKNDFCINYDYSKLPKHKLDIYGYIKDFLIVYHQGKAYYYHMGYGGFNSGILYDINTLKFVKWTTSKNCSPIFNTETKQII